MAVVHSRGFVAVGFLLMLLVDGCTARIHKLSLEVRLKLAGVISGCSGKCHDMLVSFIVELMLSSPT